MGRRATVAVVTGSDFYERCERSGVKEAANESSRAARLWLLPFLKCSRDAGRGGIVGAGAGLRLPLATTR